MIYSLDDRHVEFRGDYYVAPNAALKAGYKFKYERIDDALQNILR